jgi:hypothetical protein
MDDAESFIARVDETAHNHMLSVWKAMHGAVNPLARERVETVWSHQGRHAAMVVNDCIARQVATRSGFKLDEKSGVAMLITGTSLPFPEFCQWLANESAAGPRSGFGYCASLEGILRIPEIWNAHFSEFHHWVFSGGAHGLWVGLSVGSRSKNHAGFDLGIVPTGLLTQYEKRLVEWLGLAPQTKSGAFRCRCDEAFLASTWVCPNCRTMNKKCPAMARMNCPKCKSDSPMLDLVSGFFDAYSIKGSTSPLLYSHLYPPAWTYVRTITDADCERLKGEWFENSRRKEQRLRDVYLENANRINWLASWKSGGMDIGPETGVVREAAFLRLAFAYARCKSIPSEEAQESLFPAIFGRDRLA